MAGNAFDWLVPEQLGACVNPSVAAGAASELRERQIGLLINLHERPDPPLLLLDLQAQTLHLPVQNSDAPTQAQLDRGVAVISHGVGEVRRRPACRVLIAPITRCRRGCRPRCPRLRSSFPDVFAGSGCLLGGLESIPGLREK